MDMQEILRNVISSTNEIFRAEAGSVALLESGGQEIVIRAAVGAGAEAVRGLRLPVSKGVIGWVATHEQPALIPDVTADSRFLADIDKDSGFHTKSILCVPMRAHNHVIGVIELMNMNAEYLSEDGLRILGVIADHAALAIENARLLNRTRQQAEEQALVFGAMAILTSDLGLDTLLDAVSRQMVEALNADTCIIYRWDNQQNQLQPIQYYNKAGWQRPARKNLTEAAEPMLFSALTDRKPVIIHALDSRLTAQQKRRMQRQGIERALAIPLEYRRQPIGLVEIGHSSLDIPLTPDRLSLGEAMAAQAAVAIEHAHLFETEHRLVNQQQALLDIFAVLSAELQPEKLFQRIVERAVEVIPNAEAGSLIVPKQSGGFGFAATVGFNLAELRAVTFTDANFLELNADSSPHATSRERVQRLGYAELQKHLHAQEPEIAPPMLTAGRLPELKSSLRATLVVGHTFLGTLNVDSFTKPEAFTDEDEKILLLFANQAAIAIQNARLFAEIKAAEANYRDLFDNANDLIFSLDSNFRVSSANKETLKVTGYTLPELIGMPAVSFISSGQNQSLFEVLKQQLRRSGAPTSFELTLKNKADQEKLLEVTMRIRRGERTATELHFIARDITRRRELERQLQQTEKLSSIGKLVAGVAHELNNPLTSIVGYTNLLQESNLHAQQKRDLQIIARQAERARVIVRDLLTFARNIHLNRELVDVNEIIHASIMQLKPQLQQNDVHVVNALDFGLPRLSADPHRLEQVFINLMTNSIQALAGEPRKKVITIKSSATNDTILISLADNGPGIRSDIINRIFDPFFSTKQVGEGTGLGLSICYGIVSAHGGKIWAENIAEGGTEFLLELPVSHLPLPSPAPVATQSPPVAGSDARIMVIDDEAYLLELMDRVLGNLYPTVITTDNGRKALAKILTEPFDVIICDILMPDLSGFELFNQATAIQPELADKFIFITGNVVDLDTRDFLKKHNLRWLAKPFLPSDITAVIRQMVVQPAPDQP
ncbi:MAG: hypothetical protein Kow0031_29530 [Anaerolineae bacterium]